mgnify:CR=1 FL=1
MNILKRFLALEKNVTHSIVNKLIHTRRNTIQVAVAFALSLSFTSSFAANESLIENPPKASQHINDSWVVKYQANDFTDKITEATLLYIPSNFGEKAAFFMRCKPFFSNFSLQYSELEKNLMDGNELPNASNNFAKHGYVYDDKQRMKVQTGNQSNHYKLSAGGQKNHLTKLFKTEKNIQPGELGMSLFYSFTFKEMPSFRPGSTSDDAADFFKQLNQAIKQKQDMQFTLESDQNHIRQFKLNTQRMVEFVPKEVIDFCVTGRQLK